MRTFLFSTTGLIAAAALAGFVATASGPAHAQGGFEHKLFLGQLVRDGTNPVNQAGFRTGAEVAPAGHDIEITVTVTSRTDATVVVDVETYDDKGRRVDQQWIDNMALTANRETELTVQAPWLEGNGPFTVKVGLFEPGPYWGLLLHWNDGATEFWLD